MNFLIFYHIETTKMKNYNNNLKNGEGDKHR